jgi:HlyD family secretion protein
LTRRIFKIVLAVVIVGAAATIAVRWFAHSQKNGSAGELKIFGNIDIRQADLAFNEQERIAKVLVQEGDRVTSGQVLAQLVTNRLEASISEMQAQIDAQKEVVKRLEAGTRPQEIEQAKAEVTAARARVRNATQNFERLEKTSGSGATSRQALDDAKARLDVEAAQLEVREKALNLALEGPRKEDIAAAKSTLNALSASLSLLTVRLSDMSLTAPAAGVIQNRMLEPGEMAGPTRPVLALALTDPKWVRAYVPQPDLGRLNLGAKAGILSDSFPGETFSGWVGFISPVAEFTPKTVETEDLRTQLVYEVRVFVNDADDRLRLGMPVTVVVTPGSGQQATGEKAAQSTTNGYPISQ